MSRLRQAVDRIRDEIDLARVLHDYGYDVEPHADGREQQFSCDLHGGQDNMPSARYYPDTGQFFCFACGRSRDAVALVQEKEGLKFWQAIRKLEKRYGLEPLPWSDDFDREETPQQAVEAALTRSQTPEEAMSRLERFLLNMTRERALDPHRCAGFWEAFDRVQTFMADGGDESQAIQMAEKILTVSKKALMPEEN